MRDLVVLVADNDIAETMRALLQSRQTSLGIRPVEFDILPVRPRDGRCRAHAVEYLRREASAYRHAIVVFDRHGCGRETESRTAIEDQVERDLSRNGWEGTAKAVVIDPEIEQWVWSGSTEVARVLHAQGDYAALQRSLRSAGLWPQGAPKPPDPKQAMKQVLRQTRTPPSPVMFRRLAEKVSLRRCQCPAFGKFKDTLASWFPAT